MKAQHKQYVERPFKDVTLVKVDWGMGDRAEALYNQNGDLICDDRMTGWGFNADQILSAITSLGYPVKNFAVATVTTKYDQKIAMDGWPLFLDEIEVQNVFKAEERNMT